jgi:prepilin-type N-terminal cleavage/methylation domain-containing protein
MCYLSCTHARSTKRSFSLIELLVALSILAIVAAIIVPRFLNVRSQAATTTTQAQEKALSSAIQQWIAMGGACAGSAPKAADYLTLLNDSTGSTASPRQYGTAANLLSDSVGALGSYTLSLGVPPVPGGTAGTLFDSSSVISSNFGTQGFYYTASTNGTSGGNVSYADGAGNEYLITIAPSTGVVKFNCCAGNTDQNSYSN